MQLVSAEAAHFAETTQLASRCGLTLETDDLNKPYVRLMVAIHQDHVIAYLLSWRVADELQIQSVATHPDCRRKGIAKSLLLRQFRQERLGGARQVLLEVRASNARARSLYQVLGFEELRRRPRYYQDPEEDGIEMRLYLAAEPAKSN